MKKHRIKKRILRWKLKLGVRVLINIDKSIDLMGWPRWKRKQFWMDFVKSPETRKRILGDMTEWK